MTIFLPILKHDFPYEKFEKKMIQTKNHAQLHFKNACHPKFTQTNKKKQTYRFTTIQSFEI
jgi:hypothetical protein